MALSEDEEFELLSLERERAMAQSAAPAKKPDGSIMTDGLNYVKEHPFKTAFEPITKTVTGKTAYEHLDDKIGMQPFVNNADLYGDNPMKNLETVLEKTAVDTAAQVGESFTSPAAMIAGPVGALAPKIPGVAPALQKAGKVIAESPVGKKVGEVLNTNISDFGMKNLENRIFDLYNRTVGGAKIKNTPDAVKMKGDRIQAVKTIHDNVNDISLPDPNTGEMVSRLPENRYEQVLAMRQAKQAVWKKVQQLSKGSADQGAVIDMEPIVQDAIRDTVKGIGQDALTANPRLMRSLLREAKNVRAIGQTNPVRAEEFMKALNTELKTFRNSGQKVDYSVLDFKNNLIHRLNKATDDVIESVLDKSGYSDLRRQYGSLKSAEKEMLAAANKYGREQAGTGSVSHPIVDFWSLEEIMHGAGKALVGDPIGGLKTASKGVLFKSASKLSDYFKSPDRSMKKMYELIGKYKAPEAPIKATAELVDTRPAGIGYEPNNPYRKGLPSPKAAGQSSGPVIDQHFERPTGLPAPKKQNFRQDRLLPSPRTAGQSSGPVIRQGTDLERTGADSAANTDFGKQIEKQIRGKESVPLHPAEEGRAALGKLYGKPLTPVERAIMESKAKTDFGRQIQEQIRKKYEVPLHPAEEGKAAMSELYPPELKTNKYIKMNEADDFKNMWQWESYQQSGGATHSGGYQNGPERIVTYSNSGHSKAVQSVGPKKAFEIMSKAAEGEKLTTGEALALRRMLEDYKHNVKPYIEGKSGYKSEIKEVLDWED